MSFYGWLSIGLAGGVGCLCRYFLSLRLNPKRFPFGTLAANSLACFFWGIAISAGIGRGVDFSLLKVIVFGGLLGALSTYSTFIEELIRMAKNRTFLLCFFYCILSISAGAFLLQVGIWIGRGFFAG